MVMGGIPYYLSKMDKGLSLAQNVDKLFFSKNAPLKEEFNDLYKALFKNASPHIAVVTALATKSKGLVRKEILEQTGLADNGAFSTVLEELENCGFIRLYEPFGKARTSEDGRQKSATLYQLIDFYTLFYFNFIKNNRYQDENFWTTSLNSPLHNTWCGLSFEKLCLSHLNQIKQALGIWGIQSLACAWRSETSSPGAQVDLMIDRKDDTVNLCEIKYAAAEYEITKSYEESLINKIGVFQKETRSKKSVMLTLITTYGLKYNSHSGIVQKQVVLEDLFVPERVG